MNWHAIAWAMSIGIIGQVIGGVIGYALCKDKYRPLIYNMKDKRCLCTHCIKEKCHLSECKMHPDCYKE